MEDSDSEVIDDGQGAWDVLGQEVPPREGGVGVQYYHPASSEDIGPAIREPLSLPSPSSPFTTASSSLLIISRVPRLFSNCGDTHTAFLPPYLPHFAPRAQALSWLSPAVVRALVLADGDLPPYTSCLLPSLSRRVPIFFTPSSPPRALLISTNL